MAGFDAIVIGTGFAGSVTACRLVQAGQRICVLERGRKYEKGDFPAFPSPVSKDKAELERESQGFTPTPDFSRWFWNIGDGKGLLELRDLDGVISAQAAGYGGGSLIYANVHLRAPGEVFDGTWSESPWPSQYRRGKDGLDPFYDRVAFMLDVKPVPPWLSLAKTRQMERAAAKLGGDRLRYFTPPLAINGYERPPGPDDGPGDGRQQSGPKLNRWGKEQETCDLRGYCWMGCNRQAKNTLDLNYLAIVEQAEAPGPDGEPGEFLAEIHRMAEVKTIRRDSGEYEVTFENHLQGSKLETVRAPYVFLCAGAVNTTELLLRNCSLDPDDKDSSKGNLEPEGKVGHRYYPNADSLAAIFDCDETQDASVGPTITSSLLFDNGKDWFMVQDGGFPANLEPLFGFFRSPLWVRRNRYVETDSDHPDEHDLRKRISHHLSVKRSRPGAYVDPPFGAIAEAIRRLPGETTTLVPEQLQKAFLDDREELLDLIGKLSEERVRSMLDDLSRLVDQRLDAIAETLPPTMRDEFEDIAQFGVSRGMLRLVAQVVWGSESDMARYVAEQFADDLPKDRAGLMQSLMTLVAWALDYRAINDHFSLLLTMGRDRHAGELYLKKNPHRSKQTQTTLKARLPGPLEDTSRIVQERSLRDIASVAWNGELRTNPAWTFMRRRFTVHSQGGCAMGDDNDAVTDAVGEVRGCKGLYVMDAAAFPTSVGVNPSATIAAVAEYKISAFIRDKIDPDWQAEADDEVQAWLDQEPWGDGRTNAELLDPIPTAESREPASKPVGIRFEEAMEGFHGGQEDPPGKGSELWAEPDSKFTDNGFVIKTDWEPFARACRSAAEKDLKDSSMIAVELTVQIEDLMRYLECYAAVEDDYGNDGKSWYKDEDLVEVSQIPLEGKIKIPQLPGTTQTEFKVGAESYLWLYPNALGGRRIDQSLMYYRLGFEASLAGGVEQLELNGIKILDNQAGFDIWHDTSTLYFEIVRSKNQDRLTRGILRLHAEELLVGQLKSFKATGTTDPARQSWALAAFFRFFSGQLSRIYLPELDHVKKVLVNIVNHTHG